MKAKRVISALIIGGAAFSLSLLVYFSKALDSVEFLSSDLRQKAFLSSQKASDDVVLVLIDQKSLNWMEENYSYPWPWYRSIYGYFIRYAQIAEAKALGIDILFTSNSVSGMQEDLDFGAAVTAWPHVVFAATYENKPSSDATQVPDYVRTLTVEADDVNQKNFDKLVPVIYPSNFPVREIAEQASFIGSVSPIRDLDGKYRRTNLILQSESSYLPSFSLAMYLSGQESDVALSVSKDHLSIGSTKIPLDKNGKAVIRFKNSTGRVTTYSAQQIINSLLQLDEGLVPDIDPAKLKGKYIILGTSAPGLLDLRPLPFDDKAGGFDFHAASLENILTSSYIKTTPLLLDIIVLLLISFLIAFAGLKADNALLTAILLALILILPIAAGFGFFAVNVMIPMMYFLVTAVMTWLATAIFNYATEGAQKRYIKSAFQQYLSPAWIEKLIHDKDNLKLGGEKKELTIFFSDIQGFTSISEVLSPEDLTALLNDFLTAMSDIIEESGGTIDKYEGDAIIAFWNAPLNLEDHAIRGVNSLLACQKKLSELRPLLRERAGRDLHMRVGMNTGFAVVGNMGSSQHFNYTMLGDAVNLAARLEGINKQYGTYKMTSSMTAERTGDNFSWRELSRVAVVGKKEPVTVLEPFYHEDFNAKKDILEQFDRGLKLYYIGKFKEAISIFEKIKDIDPPAQAYFDKCSDLLKNPIPDFNGVWVMTSK